MSTDPIPIHEQIDAAARNLIPRLEFVADLWNEPDYWKREDDYRDAQRLARARRIHKLRAARRRHERHLAEVEAEAKALWDDYRGTAEMIAEIDAALAALEADD